MSTPRLKMLAIGATGSIGTLVVAEAIGQGHTVRALVRSQARARDLPSGVQVAIGDLTQHETLAVPNHHSVVTDTLHDVLGG